MKQLLRKSWLLFSCFAIGLLIVAASCDDDDREVGAPAGTGDGTPSADFGVPTPDNDEEDADDNRPDTKATVPPASEGDGTPSTSELPAPEATGTPAMVAERTVTPDSDAVGPQDEGMFPDTRTEAPDLENYILVIEGTIRMDGTEGQTESSVEIRYEQNEPGVFYLSHDGVDDAGGEIWRINDDIWVRDEDGIQEGTEEMAEGFDISVYLSMLPEIERIADAEEAGQEEIDGRMATRYTIPAEQAVHYIPGMRDADVQESEGSLEIWLDEEHSIVLRMVVDLTWSGHEGDEQMMDLEYTITNIDETDDIEPPQQ